MKQAIGAPTPVAATVEVRGSSDSSATGMCRAAERDAMKATTLLLRQHKRITMLLDAILHERHVQRALAGELVEELTAHLGAEDLLRYPAAPEPVRDLATRESDDRDTFLRALQTLTSTDAQDPAFARVVSDFAGAFQRHVAREEQSLIPAMEAAASDDELAELGAHMEQFCAEVVAAWRDVVRGGVS